MCIVINTCNKYCNKYNTHVFTSAIVCSRFLRQKVYVSITESI